MLWWLFSYPNDSKVLTTAPTWPQIEDLLWREVASAYQSAKFPLGGRLLKTQFDLAPQWFAKGQSSDRGVNIQGLHASNILVIVDEADGISKDTWDALDGLLTSANAKLLAIGNPLDPTSEWKKRVDSSKPPHTKVIQIRDEDTPNIAAGKVIYPFLLTPEWVEDKREKWGEGSPLWLGKVKAEWPSQGTDILIPITWLLRARPRTVSRGILTYGVDVARFGTNRTVRTLISGNQLLSTIATQREDTMETATRVLTDLQRFEPAMTQIDETGIGGAVLDRVRQVIGSRYQVAGVNNGGRANDEAKYANRGAEMWWNVRTAFEKDEIGLLSEDMDAVDELISDLNRPTFEYDRKGRLIVDKFGLPRGKSEYSMSTEDRAAASPDRGDAFVLAYNAARPFIQMGQTKVQTTYSIFPPRRAGVISL
mgnify:FL=1